MPGLRADVDAVAAATRFSGVVGVNAGDTVELAVAYGLADRAHEIPNGIETRFGVASATKGITAATVVSLVEEGLLAPGTPARSVLGRDLPLVRDDVTVEHLLAHRSGIGDYYDEDVHTDSTEYVLPVPVHELVVTEDYLRVLDGHETKFAPDERFSYCNSGYVVLALIAERAAGMPFDDLVRERVCAPAGMDETAFLRSDELPGAAAIGYVGEDGLRTNVLHLPVRGSGDGGIYTTAADVASFWRAFFGGRIVGEDWVEEMTRQRSEDPGTGRGYGLGFWLAPASGAVALVGADAGVSFRSVHDPARGLTHTVISNTTRGAWPVARLLGERLGTN